MHEQGWKQGMIYTNPKLEIFLFHSELVPLKQTVSPFLGLFAGGDIEYFGIFAVTLCYVVLLIF